MPPLDPFTGRPIDVRLAVDIAQVRHGSRLNPHFGLETARIDALPHQLVAVYERMLPQSQLRFLLADDPGAGKTIMAGLYISELRHRRLLDRALIVAPAGLVGNWQRELGRLFGLDARIVVGADLRRGNPFRDAGADLAIVSVDTLASPAAIGHLGDLAVRPYDLVVFDEAHKLSARIDQGLYTARTDRYRLAEALAGAEGDRDGWTLPWQPRHFVLMTATPHMGKDDPYYFLWRLLEPTLLSTREAFDAFPSDQRRQRYLRRTKEELVGFDGARLFVTRRSDTVNYPLSPGPDGERALYDAVTAYLDDGYNRAAILNREAARLAKGVYQRRLASSTLAILRSLERRLANLETLVGQVDQARANGMASVRSLGTGMPGTPPGTSDDGDEEGDADIDDRGPLSGLPDGVTPEQVLADLRTEASVVRGLAGQARRVDASRVESKFNGLVRCLDDPGFADEKVIVFTEFRDTAEFLCGRLAARGWAGQIARIDGSMEYRAREAAVEHFRGDHRARSGARFLIATDAAGEGINLQFCWLTINYDLPWNPARLEQRMGRTHRYGQRHDPVLIVNLLAGETREGRVFKVLLDKLERIRMELGSDKVFDVIGRLFQGVDLADYLAAGRSIDPAALERLGGLITAEQVAALAAQERARSGVVGDTVRDQLPRLREERRRQQWRRILPGTLRQIVERGASRAHLTITGDLATSFGIASPMPASLAGILGAVPDALRARLVFGTPGSQPPGDGPQWVHPGEPVGDALLETVANAVESGALAGTVLIDPSATASKVAVLAEVAVKEAREGGRVALAGSWLAAVVADAGGVRAIEPDDVQRWVDTDGASAQASVRIHGTDATAWRADAKAWIAGPIATRHLKERQSLVREAVPERVRQINASFNTEARVLSQRRATLHDRAQAGDPKASIELASIRRRQASWQSRQENAVERAWHAPEAFAVGDIRILAVALVVPPMPSAVPDPSPDGTPEVEAAAVDIARAYEEVQGAIVTDVSTPGRARAAGLADWPGFDLVACRHGVDRLIEVKGRAGVGEVTVSPNEWAKADTLGADYWLYVVFDATGPAPRLLRINDPVRRLPANARAFRVSAADIFASAE